MVLFTVVPLIIVVYYAFTDANGAFTPVSYTHLEDIYNEPKNAFVADFIGDSNIVAGVMHKDFLVSFSGVDFPCVCLLYTSRCG